MASPRLTGRDIEQVKQAADLVGVISEYVQLKQRGRGWIGLCPFHSEKTPSFLVHPDEGYYKCFGCGKSGDIITFSREIESVTFRDAVVGLAERYGVSLQESRHSQPDTQSVIHNAEECAWFWRELRLGFKKLAASCYSCEQQATRFLANTTEDSEATESAWWWAVYGTDIGDAVNEDADFIANAAPQSLLKEYLKIRRSHPGRLATMFADMRAWADIRDHAAIKEGDA